MGLTRSSFPSEVVSVLMCCMHAVFSCFIFVLYEIVLACVVFVLYAIFKKKNRKTKDDLLYFSAHGMRSGILCYISPARGTCSGIILLYFLRVERTLPL